VVVVVAGSVEVASGAAVEKPKTTVVEQSRRGDVDPCDNYSYDRYLPNSHYLFLLQHHRTVSDAHVVVHSERKSRKPWSDFDSIRGIILKLDANPLVNVRVTLDADVSIMSPSSISLVAALFTDTSKVVYTRFGHRPQFHWVRIDPELIRRSQNQALQIRHN
jgi:hypothetical protein